MAGKRKHRRRRSNAPLVGLLCGLIFVLGLIWVVHIVHTSTQQPDTATIAYSATLAPFTAFEQADADQNTIENTQAEEAPAAQSLADIAEASDALAQAAPAPEAAVEQTAVPAPTFESVGEFAVAESTPEPADTFEYLPVYKHAETGEKRIAITVDDCYQTENLKRIIRTAYSSGSKLTLFPIGENVIRPEMGDVLRGCVYDLGFEVENHTFTHSRIFRLPEEEMAAEIWKQRAAVCKVLGANYHQHFFRLMGGDGMYDQRTHNYLEQLGYMGIAYWSYSGSNAELADIKSVLSPGMVYLFHTTDVDTAKLEAFIPYAVSQGYQLVTMNELFGLPDNEITDASTMEAEMPTPRAYVMDYREQKESDYSWAVVCIQQRLYELNYLNGGSKSAVEGSVADGVYGEGTAAAVAAFQRDHGLPETGIADSETQRLLLEGNQQS